MKLKVVESNNYKKVITNTNILNGDEVYRCSGKIILKPTRTSIQSPYGHLEDSISACINHHCNPNTMVRYINKSLLFIAISDIEKNEEITFNYNTTEFELSNPFNCNCCDVLIRGKKYEPR